MPSDHELLAITGFRSTPAASTLAARLRALALLDNACIERLLASPLGARLPVLGTVAAGFPSPAEEELVDTMTLDEYLITNKEATYLLKVGGDSMIEAGILPGDISSLNAGSPHETAISSLPKWTEHGP